MFKGKFTIEKMQLYMNTWEALSDELDQIRRIPIYHSIKFNLILNKMHRLTKEYSEWLKNLEVLKNEQV